MLPRVLTAIVTPFTNNYQIDYNTFCDLVRYQLSHEDTGIVLFGTTGECPTVDKEERIMMMRLVMQLFPNELNNKFVIGAGGNNTSECIEIIKYSKEFGFNNFMLTTPYYNKPTQVGLFNHFKKICNEFPDCKFILYNVPGRCNVNLLPQTVYDIWKACPNVFYIKEASGDLSQMIVIRRLCPDLLLYCGDDGLIVPSMSIGAYGVISVLSNYKPTLLTDIIKKCQEDNYYKAFELFLKIDEIIKLLFSETSPAPIKYLMKETQLIKSDEVRLPLVKMQSNENKEKLKKLVDQLNY